MDMREYLASMVERQASDLYLITGAPASLKIDSEVEPLNSTTLPSGRVKQLAYSLMSDEQISNFEDFTECNIGVIKMLKRSSC